jgi:site-specific DNA recombinase
MKTIAAIYARRRKKQNETEEELKSVTRQKELARAFAKKQGWTVDERFIFTDDGISGAEFEARPGLQSLLAFLPRPPFSRLIVSEQKSIGREVFETGFTIKQLAEAGVQVFEYGHDKCLTPKSYLDKMMNAMQAGADEAARKQASERVHEAFTHRCKRGYVVGGRVFGYRNQDVNKGVDAHGRSVRSHVRRVIDSTEAKIVKRIFTMFDQGMGKKKIARILTAENVPAPFHARRTDGLHQFSGWCITTVNAVLKRETYHGVVIWNKTKKRNDEGKWDPSVRPEEEWIRVEVPELRIIDENLWKRVQMLRREAESKATRLESGRLAGRPQKDRAVSLLAGQTKCSVCGGGLIVESGGKKRGRRPEYICNRHRTNRSCKNALRVSCEEMDEVVLQAIEEHALTPEAINQVIQATERDDVKETQARLLRELADVEKRCTALMKVVEAGAGDVDTLVNRLRELEDRKKAIQRELKTLRPIPRLSPEVISNRLQEWRKNLRGSTTQARIVLERILRGRIVSTPRKDGSGYEFSAPTRFDRLFTGIVVLVSKRPSWIPEGDTTGTDHLGPEDTGDAEYGRLLEEAVLRESTWRARRESNPRPTGSKPVALSN